MSCSSLELLDARDIANSEPIDGTRIAWDNSSMQRLSESGIYAGYPRLRELNDGTLLVVYDSQGDLLLKKSVDGGDSWSPASVVFSKRILFNDYGSSCMVNMANAEIYQLDNGDLIFGANFRPSKDGIVPYSIAIKRSKDGGETWLQEQILYNAGLNFGDGCWEPSFLQLPNGELQVYFANESPYRSSHEQEISMLSSQDRGETWLNNVKTVSFRSERRDGMPVAQLINDEIVVSIEDNEVGEFKPFTVRTKIKDNWSQPVLANSLNRNYALADSLSVGIYAGAPYLIKLPSGETLLSYQTTFGRSKDWEKSTLEVAVGDDKGLNFKKITQPIDVPINCEAKWSSLSIIKEEQVVALTSSDFNQDKVGVWMIKGYILTDVIIGREINKDRPHIFIGQKGETNLRGYVSHNNSELIFNIDVSDKLLYKGSKDNVDGVSILIDPEGGFESVLHDKIFRISTTYEGNISFEMRRNNKWIRLNSDLISSKTVEVDGGYSVTLTIPMKDIEKYDLKPIRYCVELSAYNSEYNGYKELLVNANKSIPCSWMKILFN
ncbi:MAG: exo-alpha-sialidase [Bacteroidales bacterium]